MTFWADERACNSSIRDLIFPKLAELSVTLDRRPGFIEVRYVCDNGGRTGVVGTARHPARESPNTTDEETGSTCQEVGSACLEAGLTCPEVGSACDNADVVRGAVVSACGQASKNCETVIASPTGVFAALATGCAADASDIARDITRDEEFAVSHAATKGDVVVDAFRLG